MNLNSADSGNQGVRPNSIIESYIGEMMKAPTTLAGMNPQFPIVPRRHPSVVSPAILPHLFAKDCAGVYIIVVENPGRVELRYLLNSLAQPEFIPVAIYNADIRRRVKHLLGILDKALSDAVVVVQGKNVAPSRHPDR